MNLLIIKCVCDFIPKRHRYPSYFKEDKFYEERNLSQVQVYRSGVVKTFNIDQLADVAKLFNKKNIVIADNAYFHFNLLFHHFKKQELDKLCGVDLARAAGATCVRDLATMLDIYEPMNTFEEIEKMYYACIEHPSFKNKHVIGRIDTHWVEYDPNVKRVINHISGKWMIFVSKKHIEDIWTILIANRDVCGFYQARTSTCAVNIWGGSSDCGIIELFYQVRNTRCYGEAICNLVGRQLEEVDVRTIHYKTDKNTKNGKGANYTLMCKNYYSK
jgi:hypothetical protein